MWKEFLNNPCGRRVGDCSVRAISKALDVDWEKAYSMLVAAGYAMCDMPSSNGVISAVLRDNGFIRKSLPTSVSNTYTADDFTKEYNKGTYVIGFGNHVATVVDGVIYDSWDSSNEIPQYFWMKRED